jgi:PqqD family protein of HPr-rel-A system
VAPAAPAPGGGPLWRLNPLVELHWKAWDTDVLVFEAVSGETAVLDPLDAALLSCFDHGPVSWPGILASLERDFGHPLDEALQPDLRAALEAHVAKGWLQALT